MKKEGQEFTADRISMKLVDRQSRMVYFLVTRVTVYLMRRTIPTCFLVLPDAENYTLRGVGFLEDVRIVVDIANRTWHFVEIHPLEFEPMAPPQFHDVTCIEVLTPDEGTVLTTDKRSRFNALLEEYGNAFKDNGEATSYTEHYIDKKDHSPVPYQPPMKLVTQRTRR